MAQALHRTLAFRNSYRRMFSERPHVRVDGIYVSRNTYFRLGIVHWDVKNPVHLVVYYRFFRFFADGTVLTRTSAEPLHRVWQSLWTMPASIPRRDSRLAGRWRLQVRLARRAAIPFIHGSPLPSIGPSCSVP